MGPWLAPLPLDPGSGIEAGWRWARFLGSMAATHAWLLISRSPAAGVASGGLQRRFSMPAGAPGGPDSVGRPLGRANAAGREGLAWLGMVGGEPCFPAPNRKRRRGLGLWPQPCKLGCSALALGLNQPLGRAAAAALSGAPQGFVGLLGAPVGSWGQSGSVWDWPLPALKQAEGFTGGEVGVDLRTSQLGQQALAAEILFPRAGQLLEEGLSSTRLLGPATCFARDGSRKANQSLHLIAA